MSGRGYNLRTRSSAKSRFNEEESSEVSFSRRGRSSLKKDPQPVEGGEIEFNEIPVLEKPIEPPLPLPTPPKITDDDLYDPEDINFDEDEVVVETPKKEMPVSPPRLPKPIMQIVPDAPKKQPPKTKSGGILSPRIQQLLGNDKPKLVVNYPNKGYHQTSAFEPRPTTIDLSSSFLLQEPEKPIAIPPILLQGNQQEPEIDAMDIEEQPLPQEESNKIQVELDDIIPLLLNKATESDEATIFTGKFTGHVAQIKRDLYMYLMGMANQLPPKWQWAVNELRQKQLTEAHKNNPEYQSYLELKNKFEAPLPALPVMEPKSNELVYSIFSKYNISDSGKPIAPSPAQTKRPTAPIISAPKRTFATMSDLEKGLGTLLQNGSTSTGITERPTKKAKVEEKE